MDTSVASPDYYCVFAGWVPGIYTSIDDVEEMIHDFDNSSWCKFKILDNADKAWVLFFSDGDYGHGVTQINNEDAPEPVQQDHYRQKQRLALRTLHERFQQEQTLPLPHYLRPDDLASQKPTQQLLLNFSMRKMLNEACEKLDITPPLYHIVTKTFRDGCTCYFHLASVVPPPHLEPLVQFGRIAFDDENSIEDDARLTLRALCANMEAYVYDYIFDVVQNLMEKYANLANNYRRMHRMGKNVTYSSNEADEKVFHLDTITHRAAGTLTSTSRHNRS